MRKKYLIASLLVLICTFFYSISVLIQEFKRLRPHIYEFETPIEFANFLDAGNYYLYEKIDKNNTENKDWGYTIEIDSSEHYVVKIKKGDFVYSDQTFELYINQSSYERIGSFKIKEPKLVTFISEINEENISRLAYYEKPTFPIKQSLIYNSIFVGFLLVLIVVNIVLLAVLKPIKKTEFEEDLL